MGTHRSSGARLRALVIPALAAAMAGLVVVGRAFAEDVAAAKRRLVVLGDSLAAGYGVDRGEGCRISPPIGGGTAGPESLHTR
jgi:hypothetical protein